MKGSFSSRSVGDVVDDRAITLQVPREPVGGTTTSGHDEDSAMDQTSLQKSCCESDSNSNSDHSDRKPYFPERQRLSTVQHFAFRRSDSARDEDSSRLYLSEPSGTDDGDASSAIVFYDPRSGTFHENCLGSAACKVSNDSHRHALSRVPNSPGNTSLSSRETASPAGVESVVFQFAPDRSDISRSSQVHANAGDDAPAKLLDCSHRLDHANSPLVSSYQKRPAQSEAQPQRQSHDVGQSFALKSDPANEPSRFLYSSGSLQHSMFSGSNRFHSQRGSRTQNTQQSQLWRRRQRDQQSEHTPWSNTERDFLLFNREMLNQEGSTFKREGRVDMRHGLPHQSFDFDVWSRSGTHRAQSYSVSNGASNLSTDASIAMTLSDDSEPTEVPDSLSPQQHPPTVQNSNSKRADPVGMFVARAKRRVVPTIPWHKRSRRRGMEQQDLAIDGFTSVSDSTTRFDVHETDGQHSMIADPSMGRSTTCSENLLLSPRQQVNLGMTVLQPTRRFGPAFASNSASALGTPASQLVNDLPGGSHMGIETLRDLNREPHVLVDVNRDRNHSRVWGENDRLEANNFENFTKRNAEKASRHFLPKSDVVDGSDSKYRFFTCPRCKTRQREFISVSSAPSQDSGPSGYLALYFALYVISSLFIFGLEEGWKPLDCIYFAVITLTTCGLGDFVPTTPGNKLICSLFIYFGVACIGLLLGTYIAGILDDKASRDRKSKQLESCPNCKQIQNIKDAASGRFNHTRPDRLRRGVARSSSESRNISSQDASHSRSSASVSGSVPSHSFVFPEAETLLLVDSASRLERQGALMTEQSKTFPYPGSRRTPGRRGHTRHVSIDLNKASTLRFRPDGFSKLNGNLLSETSPLNPPPRRSTSGFAKTVDGNTNPDESYESDEGSEGSDSSESTTFDIMDDNTFRIRAAKYVILTIRQALLNSIVIIALGCFGFWFIEGFTIIDSWYFTTVLLTTTGYGDITPYTRGGKLFATVYILVAGTILLNNMSMISIIPLELRRRRIERAVLTQFGDELDDDALRELAMGPTVQRLHLTANRPDGLDECTREMFSLAMLVRLGKVTEEDIKETFAAFRRLDVNDEGVLNSKSIIGAMIHKSRSRNDLKSEG
jgi:Ion channel